MKQVGKYNVFKALSIFVTCVPTTITSFYFSKDMIKNSGQSISLVGVIGILIAILFLKNKIAENIKFPSPFVFATILFVIIVMIEQILYPVKCVCLVTMVVTGIDELSFKRIYKRLELFFSNTAPAYKHFGFYCCKTEKILCETKEETV